MLFLRIAIMLMLIATPAYADYRMKIGETYLEVPTDDPVVAAVELMQKLQETGETEYEVRKYDKAEGGLRPGSIAILRLDTGVEITYETLEEAKAQASKLDAKTGYVIIDLEQPVGSAPSSIIERRPSFNEIDPR